MQESHDAKRGGFESDQKADTSDDPVTSCNVSSNRGFWLSRALHGSHRDGTCRHGRPPGGHARLQYLAYTEPCSLLRRQ
jgi:hypothetical protein